MLGGTQKKRKEDLDDSFSVMFRNLYPVHRTTNIVYVKLWAPLPQFDCAPCLTISFDISPPPLPPPFQLKIDCAVIPPRWCVRRLSVDRFGAFVLFEKIKAFGHSFFFKGVIGVKTGEIILSRKVHASDLKSDCNMYKKQEKELNRKPGLCYVIADRSLLRCWASNAV